MSTLILLDSNVNTLKVVGSGTGGLENAKQYMPDDQVRVAANVSSICVSLRDIGDKSCCRELWAAFGGLFLFFL